MAVVHNLRPTEIKHVPIQSHAIDNLRYIRETMERAGSFTAVPGWGGVVIGVTALIAGVFAALETSHMRALEIWAGEAAIGVLIGLASMHFKSRRYEGSLSSPAARKFALSFCLGAKRPACRALIFFGAPYKAGLFRPQSTALEHC